MLVKMYCWKKTVLAIGPTKSKTSHRTGLKTAASGSAIYASKLYMANGCTFSTANVMAVNVIMRMSSFLKNRTVVQKVLLLFPRASCTLDKRRSGSSYHGRGGKSSISTLPRQPFQIKGVSHSKVR